MSGDGSGSHHDGRVPDGVPDFTGPAAPEPEFLPCYRHPDRSTGISCQRCRRPICMSCMQEASVGFHCPDCAGVGKPDTSSDDRPIRGRVLPGGGGGGRGGGGQDRPWSRGSAGRSSAGGGSGSGFLQQLKVSETPVTWGLVAVCLLAALAGLVSGGRVTGWLALSGASIEANQWWRLLTFGVTSAGMLGPVINALVMVLIGRSLEPLLGGARLLAVYLTACLVGGSLFVIVSQGAPIGITGMTAGTIGLIAASAAVKLRMGHDIRFDLVLLGLLVVLSFVTGFGSNYWVSQIGGVFGGGGAALIMVFAPAGRRTGVQVAGIVAVWALSIVSVAMATMLG